MNQCSLYFPLVGLFLGILYAGAFALFSLAFSPLVTIVLVVILHLFITGAFHEDGLADSVDALGGGYTVEKRLEIMKDSRIGTYGAVVLPMALLKVVLLADASRIWLALLAAPAIARLTPLLLMATLAYLSDPDRSKNKPVADGFTKGRLLLSAGMTLTLAAPRSAWHSPRFGGALPAGLPVRLRWGGLPESPAAGYTGDTLGASVVLSELVLLMFL